MNKILIRTLFILVALLLTGMSIINLFLVAGQMSDENLYNDAKNGVVLIDVTSGGVSEAAGLKVGDRLVMINGDSIRSARHAQTYLDSAKPGESLIYTIERNGRLMDIRVNLALAGLRIYYIGLITCGLLFLLFSLFIVLLKPEQPHARLLGFGALLLAFLFMNLKVLPNMAVRPMLYQVYALFTLVAYYLPVPLLQHASLYFPDKKYANIHPFWMITSHYILAGLLIVASLFIAVRYYIHYQGSIIIQLIYLIIIEIIFRKKRRKEYRARAKIIKFSGLILVAGFLVAGIEGLNIKHPPEWLMFLLIFLPLAYFYTTVRYRIFDIYIRIRLSLIYALIQSVIFILFIISLVLLISFLPLWQIDLPAIVITGASIEIRSLAQLSPDLQSQVKEGYLLLFGISIALLLYLSKNKLQSLIARVFFQQQYDYRLVMKKFGELLSSYFTRQDISHKSVEQIQDIMKVKGTSLAFASNGEFRVTMAVGDLKDLKEKTIVLPGKLIKNSLHAGMHLKKEELESIEAIKELAGQIYCGTPIFSGTNELEGILFTSEKLSESAYNYDDLELLTLFAENLGTAVERVRLYEEKAEKDRLSKEMEIARSIQLNSLPKCDPDYRGLQICSSLSPAAEVGGDYYDYLELDENRLGIIVGDVVGKGTSGAIHMSKIQGFLKSLQIENHPSEDMFAKLNTLIRKNFDSDFFFTALYGIFDKRKKTLTAYRLGHNGLIYYNAAADKVEIIEPGGMAFGITDTERFRQELQLATISYHPGDLFVLLTDGFIEAMDEHQQPFGEKRLCELIEKHHDQSPSDIMCYLEEGVERYSKGRHHDDATGVIVRISPEVSS
jgi:serine phosphatase RsbU (regulator of sigma subunit)